MLHAYGSHLLLLTRFEYHSYRFEIVYQFAGKLAESRGFPDAAPVSSSFPELTVSITCIIISERVLSWGIKH